MPELPEVETVCRQLDHLLRGQEIRSSHVIDPKLLGKVPLKFSNTLIRGVFRLAKNVVLHLETQKASGNFSSYILVHLRMTGRLIFREYPKQK
ncbi:MAG: hypothetical protein KDD59_14580, partial [Bdellovibrionales bacterium]|nr:hypothetical protein [Bdellovibrionales bacterium]